MFSNISMNRMILLLITISALVACTTGTPPQTPTAAPTPTAEPTAATIPNTYHGVALPGGGGTLSQDSPPPTWLIVGDKAVLATYGSFYWGGSHADVIPPQENPDLATANLPADAQAVILIGIESFKQFQATVRLWDEEHPGQFFDPSSGRPLKAEGKREGDVIVFTLEPIGEAGDQLLAVSITFAGVHEGESASYTWRLYPAPVATPTPVSPGVQIEPLATAGMIRFHSWSPDGETLAYWEFTPEEAAVSYTYPPGTLKFLNARTGETCQSPYNVGYGWFLSNPIAWLSDGRILIVADGEVARGTPCGDDFVTLGDLFPVPISSIVTHTPDRSTFWLAGPGCCLYEPETQSVRSIEDMRGDSPGYSWSPADDRLAISVLLKTSGGAFAAATYIVDVSTGAVEDVIEYEHRGGLGNLAGPIWLGEDRFLIQETADQGPLLVTVGQDIVQVAPELFGQPGAPIPSGALDGSVMYLAATAAVVEGTGAYHIMLFGIGTAPDSGFPPILLYHSESGEVEELRFEQMPTFSPDGRWLAVSQAPTTKADQYLKLWLQPVDPPGSEARIVLRTDAVSSDVKWTADWTKVAVGLVGGISVFSFPDGAHIRAWRTEPYSTFPEAWSPNNEFLAAMSFVFGSGDHEQALFVVPVP